MIVSKRSLKMIQAGVLALVAGAWVSGPLLAQDSKQAMAQNMAQNPAQEKPAKKSKAALSDQPKPMLPESAIGPRNGPLIEWGDPFLGTGRLHDPLVLPTGAVWSPSLWIFGSYRAALQTVDHEARESHVEAVHRLDLTANLQLSGTERIVLGVTPLHDGGDFSRYVFEGAADQEGGHSATGAHVSTFFAEFEIAELFPGIDRKDQYPLDIGFALGRQKIEFQDTFLVNDTMDSIGIVKNNLLLSGMSNARITFLYAWDEIHRGNNVEDDHAKLYGLFTSYDLADTSIDADVIYVDSSDDIAAKHYGDSIHMGISAAQRIGLWNTELRLLASQGLDTDNAAANDGVVLYLETSTSFPGAPHIFYANGFVGEGQFTSASRASTAGGPMGRTGLLFSSANLGAYGAPLNNRGQDAIGTAIGYQMFFGLKKRLTFEIGGVADTGNNKTGGFGFATRYSRKLSRHFILNLGGYVVENENSSGTGYGLRSELEVKF
ncbi:hypothetical protein [Oceanospirillum beijerinckii]|uniref:hypothetical protein n=1 Tax=Oceanospirillum beijerinckii TaxID=64976 RepID=UPI00040B8EDA|nr:hypothetical protein [Oceanospirillum beijerinckii]